MKSDHELIQRIYMLEETVREFNQWRSANTVERQEFALCQLSPENLAFIKENYDSDEISHLLNFLVDQSIETLRCVKESVEPK